MVGWVQGQQGPNRYRGLIDMWFFLLESGLLVVLLGNTYPPTSEDSSSDRCLVDSVGDRWDFPSNGWSRRDGGADLEGFVEVGIKDDTALRLVTFRINGINERADWSIRSTILRGVVWRGCWDSSAVARSVEGRCVEGDNCWISFEVRSVDRRCVEGGNCWLSVAARSVDGRCWA